MKILFVGDCMFGRDNNNFVANPFINIEHFIKKVDIIIFNLETVISPNSISEDYRNNKVFNYQSNGIQLLTLRSLTNNPIIVSIANNHSLDYKVTGHINTKQFLLENNILFAEYKNYLELDELIYISVSDHCGCRDIKHWGKYIWIIDYNNLQPFFDRIKEIKQKTSKTKKFIVSIHWGSNWLKSMPNNMIDLGHRMIDNGVSIIYGHSAHHIPPIPIAKYKDGLIIYGLGDFINDYAIDTNYRSDESLMCAIDTDNYNYSLYKTKRVFNVKGSSIPQLL